MYESRSDNRVGWVIVVFRWHSCQFDGEKKESEERIRVLESMTTEEV